MNAVIELREVSKYYKRRGRSDFIALASCSIRVESGEVLGVIGRNGAGKSTLLQILCGTLKPSLGQVFVRGRISALLELGAGFHPEFTGRENIELGAALLGLSASEIRRLEPQIIEFADIGSFIDEPIKTYSSGMVVRLGFALAVCLEPDLLIIDEALSVGDGAFARKSFQRILELKQSGCTIVFCSHSMYQIEALCDRVLWLEQGHTQAIGKPQVIVSRYQNFISLNTPNAPGPAQNQISGLQLNNRSLSVERGGGRILALKFARICNAPSNDYNDKIHEFSFWQEVSPRRFEGAIYSTVQIPFGEGLRISLFFKQDPELAPPTIGFTLSEESLGCITSWATHFDHWIVKVDRTGLGQVCITIPSVRLKPGLYTLGVVLGDTYGLSELESIAHACAIEIIDPESELSDFEAGEDGVESPDIHKTIHKDTPSLCELNWKISFQCADLPTICHDPR